MPVTAVIVNYNAGERLADCLAALFAGSCPPGRTLVVDNASGDGSATAAERQFQGRGVGFIHNPDNRGFARAVNQGIALAGRDDVLVLNPDCELAEGALAALIAALGADPQAGLAGPWVEDAQGRAEAATLRRFPTPGSALAAMSGAARLARWLPGLAGFNAAAGSLPGGTTRCEAVSGACMLISRQALDEIGGFDEAYAMHCEDLDLMCRLQRAGRHCLFVPAARAVHHQGVSSRSRPAWVHFQKHRGMQRFYRKFQAGLHPWPLNALVTLGIWLRWLVLLPVAWLRR